MFKFIFLNDFLVFDLNGGHFNLIIILFKDL